MSDNSNLYDRLVEPFPVEMERTVRKSGTELVYLPVSEIINRMNRIFGPTGWSHEVISCGRDPQDPEWVTAHVRVMTVENHSREKWTVNHHDGFGGVRIKRTKQGDIVDLGDEFKGAVSDALKKACQHFGVGLYLARDIDAIEVDEAMHASSVPQASAQSTQSPPEMPSDTADKYSRFKDLRDKLTEDQRGELREWWSQYSGGQPIPRPSEFTVEQLDALILETTRIVFNGSFATDLTDSGANRETLAE